MKHKGKPDVIRKATEVFSLHGPKSASMELVAMKAGVSKRSLYEWFNTKERLVLEVVNALLEKTNQFSRVCRSMSPNALIELNHLFTHIHQLMREATPQFLFELRKYYSEAYQLLESYSHRMVTGFIESNLERGVVEAIYRRGVEGQRIGQLYYWLLKMTMEDISMGRVDIPDNVSHIHEFLVHGIINADGDRLLRILKINDTVWGIPFSDG